MFARKIRKLLRDPGLFCKDFKVKVARKIKKTKPKTISGKYRYAVVSAVHNVEKYLDEFLGSLVAQKLDFRKNISLILVDDGSVDGSAKVIEKWVNKYPDNIKYIYQENARQASARNHGLKHARGDFVTFIDPDDFLSPDYFSGVDKALSLHYDESVAYAACKLVMYNEANKATKAHPLNGKFRDEAERIPLESKRNMQSSAASAFFSLKDLAGFSDRPFPEDLKPGWEDAFFINMLSLQLHKTSAILIPSAEYFYRKRADASSTVDKAWENNERYTTQLEHGFLKILEEYKAKRGHVPRSIQNLIMYEMSWYIRRFVSNPQHFSALDPELRDSLKRKMKKIFDYLDEETIKDFEMPGFSSFYLKGTLSYFKNREFEPCVSFIKGIDHKKKLMEISTFCSDACPDRYSFDQKDTIPIRSEIRTHWFLGEVFIYEKVVLLPYVADKQSLIGGISKLQLLEN